MKVRIGTENAQVQLISTMPGFVADTFSRYLGNKQYEMDNHLGNVLATVSDRKIPISLDTTTGTAIDHYEADVLSSQDYYGFGMEEPGRNFSLTNYRYAFNGKEKTDEIYGAGDAYDYGMRFYDPRLGRFMGIDPLAQKYPMLTPYQFASNTPIWGIDWDGLEVRVYTSTQGFIGHTFLTVGKGKDLTVYSYGQFGKPGIQSCGGYSPTGEGVLYRWTGEKAQSFIKTYVQNEQAKVYEISNADEKKTQKSLDDKFNSGTTPTTGRAKNDPNAKVIDSYNVYSNNCVTQSASAVQAGQEGQTGVQLDFIYTEYNQAGGGYVKDIVNTPDKMDSYLGRKADEQNSGVKVVTDIVKKEIVEQTTKSNDGNKSRDAKETSQHQTNSPNKTDEKP